MALSAAFPASLAFANDAPDEAVALAVLEDSCDECVSPEAVEEIVDQGVAPAEMHPITAAEAESFFFPHDEEPASASEVWDEDEPRDEVPLDDPIAPGAPLRGSPADSACGLSAAPVLLPAPTVSLAPVVRTVSLLDLAPPLEAACASDPGVIRSVTPVIVWLRTRTRAHASSEDDHASNR